MAGIIAFIVALGLMLGAITLLVQERLLRRRLAPIEAKLLNPGQEGQIDPAGAAKYQWESLNLSRSISDGSEPHTRTPTQPTASYTASWEYIVDGKLHRYTHTQSSPVFRPDQIRYWRVQVFYDRNNPAVSRPVPGAGEQAWAWFIAAAVVAVVALAMTVIPNLS
jgi:hypothetical protein